MSEEKQLTQGYADFVIKHRAAYAGFKSIYEDKNPRPKPMVVDGSDWYIAAGVTVIVVASVIVSGSRTIAEFGGGVVGVAAFVMLECAVVAYAFIYTKNNINDERIDDVRKLTKRGMWLALIVAVVANIHATLKQHGVISSDAINLVILVLVGISAPLLAYISGDIAGLEYMRALSRARKVQEQNDAQDAVWLEGLNRAWSTQQTKWGVRVEVMSEQTKTLDRQTQTGALPSGASVLSASDQTDSGQSVRAGYGHTRTPDGQAQVIAYLNEHPEDAKRPSRELAKLIGVGHDTANKGRNVWRNQQVDSEVQS